MSDEMITSTVFSICGFLFGWVTNEAYEYYKDAKDKRWH